MRMNKTVHSRDAFRLIGKGAGVQKLHAKPFVSRQNSAAEKSRLFFFAASATVRSKSAFFTKSGRKMTEIRLKSDPLVQPAPSAYSCRQKHSGCGTT